MLRFFFTVGRNPTCPTCPMKKKPRRDAMLPLAGQFFYWSSVIHLI